MSVQPASTCLDNIIGLSRSSCDCREFPIDSETSISGLYLDGLPGITLKAFDSIEDCDEGNVWNILNLSRADGVAAFFTDLPTAMLQTKYDYYQEPFRGVVGNAKFNADKAPTGSLAGQVIYPLPMKAGIMKMKRIGLIFNQAANFNLYIFSSSDPSTPIATYNVNSVQNKLEWFDLPSPLELPMYEDGYEYVEYFIAYDYNGTYKPKNNGLVTGCGCNYYYNRGKVKFANKNNNRWRNFLMVAGTAGSSAQAVFNTTNFISSGNGLIFDMEISCQSKNFICDQFDFENDANSQAMAYAVWYKSGAILIDRILASGNINRYTMSDRDRLLGVRNNYSKEYWNRIAYLVESLNVSDSGCYICKRILSVEGIQSTWTDKQFQRESNYHHEINT